MKAKRKRKTKVHNLKTWSLTTTKSLQFKEKAPKDRGDVVKGLMLVLQTVNRLMLLLKSTSNHRLVKLLPPKELPVNKGNSPSRQRVYHL
jgi:hypothetical protein